MIVVEQVDQIEVFVNEGGTITIRQGDKNDESLVVFPANLARAVIKGINAAMKDLREAQA